MRLLRGLGSQLLPCGCLTGIYETYAGTVVTLVDACGERCEDAAHRVGEQITDREVAEKRATVDVGVDPDVERSPSSR
jgi:hypothetical protein